MDRQEANRLILKQISVMVEQQPELRFHQILFNMGINESITVDVNENTAGGRFVHFKNEKSFYKDLHHEESVKTLERLNKKDG